jgi:hypothetical protein
MLKLAVRILVEAADADVADVLTVQGVLLSTMCQEEVYNSRQHVSSNPKSNAILTFPCWTL